jgi:hypothetical protein
MSISKCVANISSPECKLEHRISYISDIILMLIPLLPTSGVQGPLVAKSGAWRPCEDGTDNCSPKVILKYLYNIYLVRLFHKKLHIKFEFGFDSSIFHEVVALGLRKILLIISCPRFSSLCLQIFIWYLVHIALPHQVTDQVWVMANTMRP